MDDMRINNLKKSFEELKWYEWLMGVRTPVNSFFKRLY